MSNFTAGASQISATRFRIPESQFHTQKLGGAFRFVSPWAAAAQRPEASIPAF
jgi:hypothetical protein